MTPRRYGSRRSPIATNDVYGRRFREFVDSLTFLSPMRPVAESLLYSEDYPVAPFATPRDRFDNLMEEPEYQSLLTEAGMSGQGLPTAAVGSVKFNKLRPYMQTQRYEDLPIFDPAEHAGKKIASIEADLTAGSRMYKGVDGSTIPEAEPMLGGPEFVIQRKTTTPFANLDPETQRRVAEARTKDGLFSEYPQPDVQAIWASRTDDLLKGDRKQADLVAVLGMMQDSHASNQSMVNATLKTLIQYAKDKRISKKDIKGLDKIIQQTVPEFPGIESPNAFDVTNQMSFEQRKAVMNALRKPAAEALGSPVEKIIRENLSDEFAGTSRQQPLLALNVYRDAAGNPIQMNMGQGDLGTHPSYDRAFAGEVVGRFAAPTATESLFPTFFKQGRASGQEERGIRRGIQLGAAMEEITPDMNIRTTPYENIKTPRQAQLATDAGLSRFHVMDRANAAGVVPFLRELRLSPAAPTLTQYSREQMNDMLKTGQMTLYGLGKGPEKGQLYSNIGFGLKRGEDYAGELNSKQYRQGFDSNIFSSDDVAIVSVFNNEPGARGIAGPGTMLEAIRQGGNVLDAFAVKTKANPTGLLPQIYRRFGFEVVAEQPFNKKYFTTKQIEDMVAYWRRLGWKPSDGMPSRVIMKYTGDPNVRQNPVREFFEQGEIRTSRGTNQFDSSSAESFIVDSGGSSGRVGSRPSNQRNDQGGMGRNNTLASRGRYPALLEEITTLQQPDAINLGLQMDDISRLKSLLFD